MSDGVLAAESGDEAPHVEKDFTRRVAPDPR